MQARNKFDYMINGGFFWSNASVKWINQTVNLIYDGKTYMNSGDFSKFTMNIHNKNKISFGEYKKDKDLTSAIGGSPSLIKNGKINIDHGIGHENSNQPRTAIGITKDRLILVTADGRQTKYKGTTLKVLADYLLRIGCIDAINLDGGGSTIMLKGNKVVNSPTEERLIHNAIGIRLK